MHALTGDGFKNTVGGYDDGYMVYHAWRNVGNGVAFSHDMKEQVASGKLTDGSRRTVAATGIEQQAAAYKSRCQKAESTHSHTIIWKKSGLWKSGLAMGMGKRERK